ncbi:MULTISPECIES: DUF1641 domain-containing protein [Acidiplasma]|nr:MULTISPECIES: DUF1641 domain-containing protein [Acidiplasma]
MDETDMQKIMSELEKNKDVLDAFSRLIEKLKGAGLVQALDYITENVIPDNLDFFAKSFTSPDFTDVVAKSGNTIFSLLYMLSNPEMSDIIKGISFNSTGIAQSMVDGASSAQPLSILKLMSMLKDPEIAAGLMALMNMLKVLGTVFKKLK